MPATSFHMIQRRTACFPSHYFIPATDTEIIEAIIRVSSYETALRCQRLDDTKTAPAISTPTTSMTSTTWQLMS